MSDTHYKFVVWCRDCTGNNSHGCFGGGTETVDDDNGKPIINLVRAIELAEKFIGDSIWEYDVYKITDGVETPVNEEAVDEAYWKYCQS